MNELVEAPRADDWHKLKMLVLDSVSSPITRRVYNMALEEFFSWYRLEARSGFTKATVSAWRVSLEVRRLGLVNHHPRLEHLPHDLLRHGIPLHPVPSVDSSELIRGPLRRVPCSQR